MNYARRLEHLDASARRSVAAGLNELTSIIESLWPNQVPEDLSRGAMKALDNETAPETAGLLAAFVESLGRIAEDDVIGETSAQIARVRDAGVHVTHVDSHRHAHLIPGIWTGVATATEAAQAGPLRMPVERFTMTNGYAGAGATLRIGALHAAAKTSTRRSRVGEARP